MTLNSDCKTAAGHVELLVLSQDVNLLDGEWVHLVVKWFHFQVL